jgi:hypothetical protein
VDDESLSGPGFGGYGLLVFFFWMNLIGFLGGTLDIAIPASGYLKIQFYTPYYMRVGDAHADPVFRGVRPPNPPYMYSTLN